MNQGTFNEENLVKIDKDKYVILNSGGPLLLLECLEGENAIVSWTEGKLTKRRMIPIVCLSRLVPLTKE